ncbi:MAG: hypothetical protein IIB19_04935 [Chloroflexi bacterium]|nr:hypothetical protein [Chloroflexota bacterium]
MMLEPFSFIQGVGESPLMGVAAVVQKPRGNGRLVFSSADPHVQPDIQPDFLQDASDLERLVEGLEIALRFVQTPEMRKISERIVWPRPEVGADRDKLRLWARRACGSAYHPCGTAPMGDSDDAMAVVDQYGRVFGVEGLYVADASIMPTIPRANINIPTIMIGERFGEWLREDAV